MTELTSHQRMFSEKSFKILSVLCSLAVTRLLASLLCTLDRYLNTICRYSALWQSTRFWKKNWIDNVLRTMRTWGPPACPWRARPWWRQWPTPAPRGCSWAVAGLPVCSLPAWCSWSPPPPGAPASPSWWSSPSAAGWPCMTWWWRGPAPPRPTWCRRRTASSYRDSCLPTFTWIFASGGQNTSSGGSQSFQEGFSWTKNILKLPTPI